MQENRRGEIKGELIHNIKKNIVGYIEEELHDFNWDAIGLYW